MGADQLPLFELERLETATEDEDEISRSVSTPPRANLLMDIHRRPKSILGALPAPNHWRISGVLSEAELLLQTVHQFLTADKLRITSGLLRANGKGEGLEKGHAVLRCSSEQQLQLSGFL
jgi:hypothetical protein